MIGPIGIDHADLRQRGIALFRFKIILAERDIVRIHRKGVFGYERLQPRAFERNKAV